MTRRDILWLAALVLFGGAVLLLGWGLNEMQDQADLEYDVQKSGYEHVLAVLERGVNVNFRVDGDGDCSPLYYAIARGELEMARALLEHGADPAIVCADPEDPKAKTNGETPLHVAVRKIPGIIPDLLARGAPADAQNRDGWTPLHDAAMSAADAIPELLAHGAVVDAKDVDGRTPLMFANHLSPELVAPLIEHGADVNATDNFGSNILSMTVSQGNSSLARYLVAHGATLPANPAPPFHDPVTQAALSGELETVKFVVELGYDVADASAMALRTRKIDVLRYLLDNGMNANTTDLNGRTPLFWAHNTEMAKLLLDYGADPNAVDQSGMSPLHKDHYIFQPETIALLINAGADVNAVDAKGRTPLHVFAGELDYGQKEAAEEIVELLLANGAMVTVPDDNGNTPLHEAVSSRGISALLNADPRVGIVRLLLEHGADPKAVNYAGRTPIDMQLDTFNQQPIGGIFNQKSDQQPGVLEILDLLRSPGDSESNPSSQDADAAP